MARLIIWIAVLCAACSQAAKPENYPPVAAFEVPLPNATDRSDFIAMLKQAAERAGYHVDAASSTELREPSGVLPTSFNATVWRGNDEEVVASAMDFQDHLGRVWISFSKGSDPTGFERFMDSLVPQIKKRWPNTASLPIMPTGAIPLAGDLVRTSSGYKVNPSAIAKYQLTKH